MTGQVSVKATLWSELFLLSIYLEYILFIYFIFHPDLLNRHGIKVTSHTVDSVYCFRLKTDTCFYENVAQQQG